LERCNKSCSQTREHPTQMDKPRDNAPVGQPGQHPKKLPHHREPAKSREAAEIKDKKKRVVKKHQHEKHARDKRMVG
jgi:hypothetical protein